MTSPPPDDVDVRVAQLEQRVAALSAALASGRRTRRLILVAFLGFVLAVGWGFYSLANSVRSNAYQARLIAELQKSVDDHQDELTHEAQALVDGIGPVVSAALSEQARRTCRCSCRTSTRSGRLS